MRDKNGVDFKHIFNTFVGEKKSQEIVEATMIL